MADGSGGVVIIDHLQDTASSALTGGRLSHDTAGTADTKVYSIGPRFTVTHVTDDASDQAANTGFKIQYNQIPCGAMGQV